MEPIDANPVVEYVLAGEDAERICSRGFMALRNALRNVEVQAVVKQMDTYYQPWGIIWRFTQPGHDAYPAVLRIRHSVGRPDSVTACAYSGDQNAIDFVRDQGFSTDEMHTATGRFSAAR